MSSGEVLISELFVSRRKERKDLAARWEKNGDSGKSFGNTVSRLLVSSDGICSKKKNRLPFSSKRNNIYRDQIQNQYIYTINYKIYLQLHKIYFEYD